MTSYTGIFSGRTYTNARPLGHTDPDWQPRFPDRRELVTAVLDAFDRHQALGVGPLGPRGCGYALENTVIGGRLVVKGTINGAKAKAADLRAKYGGPVWTFTDISDITLELRRSGQLPWGWVDDGRTRSSYAPVTADLFRLVSSVASRYDADILVDQDHQVELFVEANGGMGFWSAIAHRWSVPVTSGSGMTPVAAAYEAAQRWSQDGRPVVAVVVTDYDPSGLIIADRLAAETTAFATVDIDWHRIALNEHQVDELGLTKGGPKKSNGFSMDWTAEAEALTGTRPDYAKRLFDDLMSSVLDLDGIERTRADFQQRRAEVQNLLVRDE